MNVVDENEYEKMFINKHLSTSKVSGDLGDVNSKQVDLIIRTGRFEEEREQVRHLTLTTSNFPHRNLDVAFKLK